MGLRKCQLIISSPPPTSIPCEDYDLRFVNGLELSFSIFKDLGDTVDFDTSPLSVIFHFAKKTSPIDSSQLPAEDVTLMLQHILSISKRFRLVTPQTEEQHELFKKTLHQLTHTVQ